MTHVGAARRAARSSWPSGCDRSSVTVRLLRPSSFHHRPTPSLVGPCPRGGSAARVLDLDHVGAEVAEQRGGERPGEQRRDVEDPEAFERRGRFGRHS